MMVRIEVAGEQNLDDWANLRAALWPVADAADHRDDYRWPWLPTLPA